MQDNIEEAIEEKQVNIDEQCGLLNEKIDKIETYSTEEQVIGTWIDGKPIYRKVVSTTISDFAGTKDIDLNVTDVDVFTDGKVLINTSSYTSIDYSQSSTSYYMRHWIFRKTSSNNTVSVVVNMSDGVTGTIYVIIEYTKTTD